NELAPHLDIPHPFAEIGPQMIKAKLRNDPPKIIGEFVYIGKKLRKAHLTRQRRGAGQGGERQQNEIVLPPPFSGRALIRGADRLKLLLGKNEKRICQADTVGGGRRRAPIEVYDLFLRKSSTNLISSTTGSYSLCVTGCQGASLPSE